MPGNEHSSLSLVGVPTADHSNDFNDDGDSDDRDAIEADFGVVSTIGKSSISASGDSMAVSKPTAYSAAQESKERSQAAVDKAPAPADKVSKRRQRIKASATKIKARKVLDNPSKAQDVIEATTKAETGQFDSDEVIAKNDPYFKIGCQRRMVFTSDPVPLHQHYAPMSTAHCTTTDLEYPSAVEKFLDWCKDRNKTPRHFVLKMGPPDGRYGLPP
jgi:hypothetical protein